MPPPEKRTDIIIMKEDKSTQVDSLKECSQSKNSSESDKNSQEKLPIEEDKQVQLDNSSQDIEDENNAQFDFPLSPRNRRKMMRWGKCQDKKLFGAIRSLEEQGVLRLEDLLAIDPETEAKKNKGVIALAKKIQWKCKYKNLVLRVRKLDSKKFSFREIKTLKRIIKREYQNKPIDYEKILYHFPGKSMEKLVRTCKHISDCITNRSLSNFGNEE